MSPQIQLRIATIPKKAVKQATRNLVAHTNEKREATSNLIKKFVYISRNLKTYGKVLGAFALKTILSFELLKI